MIIVAAWRPLQHLEGLAAIPRPIESHVGDVDDVGVFRVDGDAAEVPAATHDARGGGNACERASAIVGAEQAASVPFGEHIDAGRASGSAHRDSRALNAGRQAGIAERPPGIAAIFGFIDAVARTGERSVRAPRWTTRAPRGGIEDARVARLEGQVHSAGL